MNYPKEIDLADDDIKLRKAANKLSSFRLAHLTSLHKFINEAGNRSINGGPLSFVIPLGDNDPNVLYTAISSRAKGAASKGNQYPNYTNWQA